MSDTTVTSTPREDRVNLVSIEGKRGNRFEIAIKPKDVALHAGAAFGRFLKQPHRRPVGPS